jgi:hypothetical protein
MKRRLLAAMLAPALLACSPEAPPGPTAREPTPTAPRPPERPPAPPPPPVAETPPEASSAPVATAAPAPSRFTLIELSPTQGDLTPLLRDEAKRARDKGLVAVLEFHADWCAPCRVFQANLRAPEIAAALEGVHLVRLNLDDWHDKLPGTGFAPRTIPSFYVFGADGRPAGKMLDGDKWGKASPARMGAALAEFLRSARRP